MLLFSTTLDVTDDLTDEKFVRLLIDWNQLNPHKENIISSLNDWDEQSLDNHFEDENRFMDTRKYRNGDIIMGRYEKTNREGVVWDSDFILNQKEKKMAIQLERGFLECADVRDMDFSSPFLIKLMIDRGFVKNDGMVPVTYQPISIGGENIKWLIDAINGESECHFPIVYVSRNRNNNTLPIDVDDLAYDLKGIAHVFVEDTVKLDSALRNYTDDKNEFDGAIGIYFPNQAFSHKRLNIRHSYAGNEDLLFRQIDNYVFNYVNSLQIPDLYTWYGVYDHILTDKRSHSKNKQKEAANARNEALFNKKENDDLMKLANKEREGYKQELKEQEKDQADYTKEIKELYKKNQDLREQNQELKKRLVKTDEEKIFLSLNEEDELTPYEFKDIVLEALQDVVGKNQMSKRRLDVIHDILKSNEIFGYTKE